MARTGRPKITINQDLFEDLCGIFCTRDEICAFLKVSEPTLRRWVKRTYAGQTFDAVWRQKSEAGHISLRRAQMKLAKEGNPTMLIWLGKNRLGQRDQMVNFNIDLGKLDDEQLERIAAGEDPNTIAGTSGTGTETTPLASELVS